MKGRESRILTTHVGSLPRPEGLVADMRRIEAGHSHDEAGFQDRVRQAVIDTVAWQSRIGLDIVADGEMGKLNFINYVNQRLKGFAPLEPAGTAVPFAASREVKNFPEFYHWFNSLTSGQPSPRRMSLLCTGPVSYVGGDLLAVDIANLKGALAKAEAVDAFMPSISPATIAGYHRNAYYKSDEDFLFAIADAMHDEYKAIVDAGLILQIDDPRLVTHYLRNPDLSLEEWRRWAEVRIEALNRSLRGIPEERIRHHTCYGINMGPRVHDLEMKHIIGLITRIKAGGYSFEAANPRHEHEWKLWENVDLPESKVLIPGVITHSTYVVEHPELVAQRIERFAGIVGRERVIAGADCGFASSAIGEEMHPSIVQAKFEALVEGARLASARLWS